MGGAQGRAGIAEVRLEGRALLTPVRTGSSSAGPQLHRHVSARAAPRCRADRPRAPRSRRAV